MRLSPCLVLATLAVVATAQQQPSACRVKLPYSVEWHIPVGCGFSGFVTEVLGLASVLSEVLPEMAVVTGECAEEFFERQLFFEESAPFRWLNQPWTEWVPLDAAAIDAAAIDAAAAAAAAAAAG